MAGFIKLHRKFLKWGWYDDPNTKVVFLHLLLNANWDDGEYHGVPIKAGQVVFGRKKYAKELGLSERNVRTAINHLHQSGEISTSKVTNRFTVITIENWAKYQIKDCEGDQQGDQQVTNNRPTSDQQPTTSKNIRNKEVKNKEDIYGVITEAWNSLPVSSIKSIRPNTSRHKMLNARIKEYGIDAVVEAIENISESPFLLGRVNEFVITFDWFIKPGNFAKVYEGNYKERKNNESHSRNNQDFKGRAGADEIDYGEGWG